MTLGLYINQIRDFCKTIIPQKVRFDSLDSFSHQTFFISPDEKLQLYLNNIIIDMHKSIGFDIKNTHAHMTVARGLDSEKIKKVQEQFNTKKLILNLFVILFMLENSMRKQNNIQIL